MHRLSYVTGRQDCSTAFPKHSFATPVLLPGLRAGQSPYGTGHKHRTQEGCDTAPGMHPAKSLLEKEGQETGSSPFHKKRSLTVSLLPSRICPITRRLKQRRYSCCILMLSLAGAGLETVVLHAGEVSSAQLPCALPLVLTAAYLSFQPMAFTFFWRRGVGSCNKSCHNLVFNL